MTGLKRLKSKKVILLLAIWEKNSLISAWSLCHYHHAISFVFSHWFQKLLDEEFAFDLLGININTAISLWLYAE